MLGGMGLEDCLVGWERNKKMTMQAGWYPACIVYH